jgi:adenosylcobinamide-GDP ribazoletransferase
MAQPPENQTPESETPQAPEAPSAITVRAPSPENMWAEIVIAVNYLTRLNLSLKEDPKPRMIRKSMAWFPLIGALVGTFGASVDWVMSTIGLPGIITATFAVISMLWATRAMHEEEFASLANQYGQTFDKEQKIGWLREERSVRYGTLAVVLVIIMKIGAIASLANNDLVFQGLIAAGCWSRTLMVVAAAWLRPIEGDPVADHFQQPPALRVIVAVVLGVLITFIVLNEYAGYALGVGAVAGLVVSLLGAYHLRGYNGPMLGTLQQVTELAILGMLLAFQ